MSTRIRTTGKMQALILEEPGCLTVQYLPIPLPGPGEILLRVRAATTCGTDLKAFLRGHPQIPMPGVLGHEYSGEVALVGPGSAFKEGEEIMGVHSAPCQKCRWCLRGQENLCHSIMATKVLGAYAEYLLIPARIARLNVFHKPNWLPHERAVLLEPLACVAQGIETLHPDSQDEVLIIGPGAIGLMFVAALRQLGVTQITLAGRNKERLAIGEQLGARAVYLEDLTGEYDKVVECTGKLEVWERSVDFARRGGSVMLFGGCPSGTRASFDTGRLHYDQITLLSPFHFGTKAVRTARSWLLDPEFDISALITSERELGEGARVFEDLREGRGIKFLFRP
ncbi:MAG: alcohol dehydrogenase catalytic domain-containing protein [Fimbriimonadaceae bacterium]|nr:alcohol dehydrogenase catalytic domain-containing protein [Fimbriimonadaceae bacterium]